MEGGGEDYPQLAAANAVVCVDFGPDWRSMRALYGEATREIELSATASELRLLAQGSHGDRLSIVLDAVGEPTPDDWALSSLEAAATSGGARASASR